MSTDELWSLGFSSIKELEAEHGILASARNEAYGCVFGRDSLITALSLLKAYEHTRDTYFLGLVRKILLNLVNLQGREVNIESGEEPGKCIHEYRIDRHEHLTKLEKDPWFVYKDASMRNYDTVDATPLFLMTLYEYLKIAPDEQDRVVFENAALAALKWLRDYGDSNGDGFVDYQFHPTRVYGGLRVQSWMDSTESVFFERSDDRPSYAIAPIEVQAYTYVALKNWSMYFAEQNPVLSEELSAQAGALKTLFNKVYVLRRGKGLTLAYAIDGVGRRLSSARSTMAHCLWATTLSDNRHESILDTAIVPEVIERLFAPDLFVPSAGIRTLSSRSRCFNPNSYHNGSIWPHDTALFAEGLEKFGYNAQAKRVRASLVRSYAHFKTPIELFGYSRGFQEYIEESGRGACRTQAWSAGAMLTTALEMQKVALSEASS